MTSSDPSLTQLSLPRPIGKTRIVLSVIAFFSFVGFADSAYLTASHYLAFTVPCSITHGCETVLTSAFSQIGPIPLALLGALFYLFLLGVTIHALTEEYIQRNLMMVLVGLTVIGFGMSVSFELIQVFIIHAICQYCLLSALSSLVNFCAGMYFFFDCRKRSRLATEM